MRFRDWAFHHTLSSALFAESALPKVGHSDYL